MQLRLQGEEHSEVLLECLDLLVQHQNPIEDLRNGQDQRLQER